MPQATSTPDRRSEAVRDFYEQYPYPAHSSPTLRAGFDARFVLSHGALGRDGGRPLQVLDAGCGRGVGLVACGALHPGANVLGIDLCQASLTDARAEIEQRGLTNTSVQDVDLMTLEGLAVPAGGFDVIHSSGVVHHLSEPVVGLRKLGEVLAPGGVVVFMVYGTIGRRGIKRVARALDAWLDAGLPLADKVQQGRVLVEQLADRNDADCPWNSARLVADAEFVDRYLHPLETDYDVGGMFDLVEAAGLRFLGWSVPEQWSLDGHVPAGALRDSIEALPERERFVMIEQIVRPSNLQAYLCKPGNGPRRLPDVTQWGEVVFAVNPEVQFEVGLRNLWRKHRVENVSYSLRGGERVEAAAGAMARACLLLATQGEAFHGETLMTALVEDGDSRESAPETMQELVRVGLVYVPHEADFLAG